MPIFLTKGELTFSTGGKLVSPVDGTQLEPVYLAGGKGVLTINIDYGAGITGVTNNNLAVVNAQVLAQSVGAADTCPEVQALVTTVVAAFTASLNAIATYAETGVTAPAVSDYTQVGVVGVTAGNLAAINSAINAQAGADSIVGNANDRDGADTAAEVQTIVSAYNAILQAADGVDNTANSANPTTAQYASVGVTGVSTAAHVSLLGDTIDTQASAAVDTVAKVQALADAALAVLTGAANGTAPTLAQLQLLGLGDVSANNIASVQAAIAAEPKPVHVPRERPPAVVFDEGPLILVETKRDLGQMPMPFDNGQTGA